MTDGYKIKRGLIRVNGVEKQFYPAGWKPNANTVAYYPLNSTTTVNDMSGNNHTLSTIGTVNFGDYSGVSSCYLNVGAMGASIGSGITASSGITVNIRYNEVSAPNNDSGSVLYFSEQNPINTQELKQSGILRAKGRPGSRQGVIGFVEYGVNSSQGYTTAWSVLSGWHNLCYTYSGTTLTLYVDGTLIGTASKEDIGNTKYYVGFGRYYGLERSIKGYISNAIFENKARTADEITAYYNQTKSNYGL